VQKKTKKNQKKKIKGVLFFLQFLSIFFTRHMADKKIEKLFWLLIISLQPTKQTTKTKTKNVGDPEFLSRDRSLV